MEYLKNKYIVTLYIILGIIIYVLGILFTGGYIGIKEIILGIIMFVVYYIADIFDFEDRRYKFKVFLVSFGINVVLGLFFSFIIGFKDSLYVFLFQFLYQNIAKVLIFDFLFKQKKIVIMGFNYRNEMIKKVVADKGVYSIAGIVTKEGLTKEGSGILGTYEQIADICREHHIDKIIVTEEGILSQEVLARLIDAKLAGARIYSFLEFYEKSEEKVPLKTLNEQWFLFGKGFEILHNNFYRKVKRIADLIFATVILIPALPVMLIAAMIIKLESKGPVFFIQDRIGKGNKRFKIIKFRSMVIHNKDEYSKYAGEKDNRITKFGNFMRKTRIDELPQLINVFSGDMSFVGPRPEWDELCMGYMEKIPFYSLRHSVQPGLTGWAQVNYSYGASIEDAIEKLQYDLYYIKHYSLMLDIIIFFKTIKTVIFGRGR